MPLYRPDGEPAQPAQPSPEMIRAMYTLAACQQLWRTPRRFLDSLRRLDHDWSRNLRMKGPCPK